MTHNMSIDQYSADPYEETQVMATKIQCIYILKGSNLDIAIGQYIVDLCHNDSNLT